MRNLRVAVRMLLRQPLFALTAIVSIAVGIGANTAIFTAVNQLLLARPGGVADHARIVDLGRTRNGEGFDTVGYQTYLDVRDRAHGFAGVAGYTLEPRPMSLARDGGAERIFGQQVTGNFFEVLGTRPALGRLFVPGDERIGVKSPLVVLGHELWVTRFNSDPAIAGRVITLNGEPFEVVGVAPPEFRGTSVLAPDVWVPMTAMAPGLASDELLRSRNSVWMVMLGRLADGGSIEQAQAGLDAVMAQLAAEHTETYEGIGLVAKPASRVPGVSGMIGGFMGVLMTLVGLVLLIACINLAGMQLARATARSREIAVRLALGAARRQIVGQLLLESLLLSAAGGVLGFLLGRWMLQGLWSLIPPVPFPLALDFAPDLRVLLFTAGVSLAAGLLSGLAPALQSTRPALVPALKDEARAPAKMRMRHLFVGGQLALSIVLLLAAMLLLRAFKSAIDIDPGFEPRSVINASLDLQIAGYTDENVQPFYQQLLDAARAIPGTEHAALGVQTPLEGSSFGMGRVRVPELADDQQFDADWNIVSPGFFETLRMPIVRGRAFTDADRDGAARVAIVNERFAERAWPGQDPIGRRLVIDSGDVQVIGIARDARLRIIGQPAEPYIFVPLYQQPFLRTQLFLRHDDTVSAAAVVPALREVVRRTNPNLPVVSTMDMAEVATIGLVPQRIAATLAGTLGLAGLLLAAIGLYGLMAYAVASRTREIGIRQALGAEPGAVIRMFVRQGMTLAVIGSAIGVALGLAVATAIQGLLFGVSPFDPLALATTAGTMLAVALAASYLPSRRAARVSLLASLRAE